MTRFSHMKVTLLHEKKEPDFHFRVAICPRDARPNRSTPDRSRPCELDAEIRGGRSRPCLLCADRFSADSVRFDRPAPSRPKQDARARSDSGKEAKGKTAILKRPRNFALKIYDARAL